MCYFKGNWRVGVEGKWAGPKERSFPEITNNQTSAGNKMAQK